MLDLRRAVIFAGAALIPLNLAAKDISLTPGGGDFKTVQEAVDAAQDGDRILLAPGTYPEHILIKDKNRLSIIGGGKAALETDDGGSDVITVDSVHGLTLQGLRGVHTSPGCFNPVVNIKDSEDVKIEDCDLNGSGTGGVDAANSKRLVIRGNHIHRCTSDGVSLDRVEGAEISGNLIEGNPMGVELRSGADIAITSNTVTGNTWVALQIQGTRNASVAGNIIAFNKGAGIQQDPSDEVAYGVNCVYQNLKKGQLADFTGVPDAAVDRQIVADPDFMDQESGDFSLLPASRCLGLGRGTASSMETLAQVPDLKPEEKSALETKVVWDADRVRGSTPPSASKGMDAQGFANAALLAKQLIAQDLKGVAGTAPEPPTLTQGKYERSVDFEARVSKAKEDYRRAANDYSLKLEGYPAWRRNYLLETALNAVFGPPAITNTNYDPDGQVFSADIVSASPLAKDVKETLVLKDQVANDQAEAFDQTLRAAKPRLTFALNGTQLTLASAELVIDGKAHDALPTQGHEASKPATVDVASLVDRPKGGAAGGEIAIQYSRNPELEKEYQKLRELSQKKAETSEMAALKKRIAAMEAEEAPAKTSDVDKPAYQVPENPDDFAVVIGIGKYPALPPAEFADRDAEAVRAHLAALGYPARNVMVLTNSQATKGKLTAALNSWLPNRVKETSTVFFYYSGHGAPDPSSNSAYLVPYDGDPEDLPDTAYPMRQLYEKLSALKAKRVIAAVDSCFSGAGGRSLLAKDARPLINKIDLGAPTGANVVSFSAAKAEQISGAVEDQGHGAFTYFLLKGLNGAAASPDGAVTVQSLYDYLSPKVQDAARLHNRDQNPVLQAGPDAAASRLR